MSTCNLAARELPWWNLTDFISTAKLHPIGQRKLGRTSKFPKQQVKKHLLFKKSAFCYHKGNKNWQALALFSKRPIFAAKKLQKPTIMKRIALTLMMLLSSLTAIQAMSYEEARQQAWFLTDKMAYELNLTTEQYDRAYEINLDYLMGIRTASDCYGSPWYYRDADLRCILYDWQYNLYSTIDYFFRPIRWMSGGWYYPIVTRYRYGYYYFDRPAIFANYRGGRWHQRRPGGDSPYLGMRPSRGQGMRDRYDGRGGHNNGYTNWNNRPADGGRNDFGMGGNDRNNNRNDRNNNGGNIGFGQTDNNNRNANTNTTLQGRTGRISSTSMPSRNLGSSLSTGTSTQNGRSNTISTRPSTNRGSSSTRQSNTVSQTNRGTMRTSGNTQGSTRSFGTSSTSRSSRPSVSTQNSTPSRGSATRSSSSRSFGGRR